MTWSHEPVVQVPDGAGVRTKPVPSLNSPPQTVPQSMPDGTLVTVPLLPCFLINSSIEVMELHETVSRVVPTTGVPPLGWNIAAIVLVPQLTVETVPLLLTVATWVLLEDQLAVLVRSSWPPPTSVPRAKSCVV